MTDADNRQNYGNGWSDAMHAVEDVQKAAKIETEDWADRFSKRVKADMNTDADAYARGTVEALTHFLQTGQTDKAPVS